MLQGLMSMRGNATQHSQLSARSCSLHMTVAPAQRNLRTTVRAGESPPARKDVSVEDMAVSLAKILVRRNQHGTQR